MRDRDERRGRGGVWVALLRRLVPERHRDAAVGDLMEEHAVRLGREGRKSADRWLRRQVLRSVPPALGYRRDALLSTITSYEREVEVMGMWMNDLRLAVRVLAKRPGFTGVVVTTLALGVGVTTALFGVFKGVFLQPLPLPDSDELVVVMQQGNFGCCGPSSGPDYLDWVARARSFDGMAAISPRYFTLTGLEEPERVYGTYVTASAFDFLGVDPLQGRAFEGGDEVSGGVVILSHDAWTSVFGGGDAVGSTLEVDGTPRTVIGVMPEAFDVPSPWGRGIQHQVLLPMPPGLLDQNRGSRAFPVIARLSDGTTIESAQLDMDRIMRELAGEYPETNAEQRARVFTVHEYLYGSVGERLLLILGAAGLVLLIACANVAGLQLARAASREGELSVRAALGASRRAMMRLLFSESLLLAAAGGLLGIGAAYVVVGFVTSLLPASIPRVDQVTIDGAALLFAVGTAGATALVFGLLPAVVASRTNLAGGVREGGRGTLAPTKERLRDYFIVAQIAVGLVLANGASLLVRSYAELRGQEYGFQTEGVVTMALNPQGPRYDDRASDERYMEQAIEAASSVSGVVSAGFVSRLPLAGGTNGNVQVEGWAPRNSQGEGPLVEVTSIVGDYFETMGIPLLQGRLLTADDSIADNVGVVINQTMADEVWPGESAIGKRFGFGTPPPWLTVVGVVGDVRQWGPEQDPIAQAYLPFSRGWLSEGHLAVRLSGDPSVIVPEVRRAILTVDPTQPPSNIRTIGETLDLHFGERRFYTTLIGLFALAALFLASAGVYGTVSYYVARRTRELGIRMALGAGGGGIVGIVVRRGVRLALWGVGLGLIGIWATTSIAETVVYGVAAIDPMSVLVGSALLALVAIGASALPATRALHVSPSIALRAE